MPRVPGVTWSKYNKKWRAHIRFRGKHTHLGDYKDKEGAENRVAEARQRIDEGVFKEWLEGQSTKGVGKYPGGRPEGSPSAKAASTYAGSTYAPSTAAPSDFGDTQTVMSGMTGTGGMINDTATMMSGASSYYDAEDRSHVTPESGLQQRGRMSEEIKNLLVLWKSLYDPHHEDKWPLPQEFLDFCEERGLVLEKGRSGWYSKLLGTFKKIPPEIQWPQPHLRVLGLDIPYGHERQIREVLIGAWRAAFNDFGYTPKFYFINDRERKFGAHFNKLGIQISRQKLDAKLRSGGAFGRMKRREQMNRHLEDAGGGSEDSKFSHQVVEIQIREEIDLDDLPKLQELMQEAARDIQGSMERYGGAAAKQAQLRDAFDALDEDGSGQLELEELQNALEALKNEPVPLERVQELVKTIDENSDGVVNFEEFEQIWDLELQGELQMLKSALEQIPKEVTKAMIDVAGSIRILPSYKDFLLVGVPLRMARVFRDKLLHHLKAKVFMRFTHYSADWYEPDDDTHPYMLRTIKYPDRAFVKLNFDRHLDSIQFEDIKLATETWCHSKLPNVYRMASKEYEGDDSETITLLSIWNEDQLQREKDALYEAVREAELQVVAQLFNTPDLQRNKDGWLSGPLPSRFFVTEKTKVYAGPNTTYEFIEKLYPGQIINILEWIKPNNAVHHEQIADFTVMGHIDSIYTPRTKGHDEYRQIDGWAVIRTQGGFDPVKQEQTIGRLTVRRGEEEIRASENRLVERVRKVFESGRGLVKSMWNLKLTLHRFRYIQRRIRCVPYRHVMLTQQRIQDSRKQSKGGDKQSKRIITVCPMRTWPPSGSPAEYIKFGQPCGTVFKGRFSNQPRRWCKICGKIACNACSWWQIKVTNWESPVRVCNKCIPKLNGPFLTYKDNIPQHLPGFPVEVLHERAFKSRPVFLVKLEGGAQPAAWCTIEQLRYENASAYYHHVNKEWVRIVSGQEAAKRMRRHSVPINMGEETAGYQQDNENNKKITIETIAKTLFRYPINPYSWDKEQVKKFFKSIDSCFDKSAKKMSKKNVTGTKLLEADEQRFLRWDIKKPSGIRGLILGVTKILRQIHESLIGLTEIDFHPVVNHS